VYTLLDACMDACAFAYACIFISMCACTYVVYIGMLTYVYSIRVGCAGADDYYIHTHTRVHTCVCTACMHACL